GEGEGEGEGEGGGGISSGSVSLGTGSVILLKLKELLEDEELLEDFEIQKGGTYDWVKEWANYDGDNFTDLAEWEFFGSAATDAQNAEKKSNIDGRMIGADRPNLVTIHGQPNVNVEVIGSSLGLLTDLRDSDLDDVEDLVDVMDSYDEVVLDGEGFGMATIRISEPGKYFLTTYHNEEIGELVYFEVVEGGKIAMLDIKDLQVHGMGIDVIAFESLVDQLNEMSLERMLAQNALKLDDSLYAGLKWVEEMYENDARYFNNLLAGTAFERGFMDRYLAIKKEYEQTNHRVLTGFAEPGKRVVVVFRSATFASVVIADKETGYFEAEMPEDIGDGDHVAYVYSVDDERNAMSSVVRMVFKVTGV
ncbi:hypothetical protein HOF67_01775, partial [Candidatus Peregrinibacteria bacterium]|nr:hypothetical protein [Candidatus Peregrinibacteria bacterium]